MEPMLKLKNVFGKQSFISDLSNERLSTLILAKDKNEINLMLKKLKDVVENSSESYDIICIGASASNFQNSSERNLLEDKTFGNVEDVLFDLVKYAHNCRKSVIKKGFKSLTRYNQAYKIFDSCRTIVVIPALDDLMASVENPRVIKDAILQLLKIEEYSGVSVVACSTLEADSGLDFSFLNAFTNRALFNVDDRRVVSDASLGMYKSTEMLSTNEFYYFSSNSSNGIMMCV